MTGSVDNTENGSDRASFVDAARKTSEALRALSHEHRLLILGILARSERSVGELEKLLNLPQPAVSQQLARLRLDNLVNCRRDGRTIYYSLAAERVAEICGSLRLILEYRESGAALESAQPAQDDVTRLVATG